MEAKNAVVKRIRAALSVRFEYASRSDKPNEPPADFINAVMNATARVSNLRWSPRESNKAVMTAGAEDEVFEFNLTIRVLVTVKTFYCKGFFAPKGSVAQGVEIQSFRREP